MSLGSRRRWFLRKGTDDIVMCSCDIRKDHSCKVVLGLRNKYGVSDLEKKRFCGLATGHKTDCSELESKWEGRNGDGQ